MATPLPPASAVGAGTSSGGDTGVAESAADRGSVLAGSEIFPPFNEPIEIKGTPASDVLIGTDADEHIRGLRGNDVLFGGGGSDQLEGGSGNDRLEGGPGFDSYNGGPDEDTLSFRLADGPVSADLASSSITQGGTFEFVQGVEHLTGSPFGDTLLGDEGDNVLTGGEGVDLLNGRLGDDILDGGKEGAYATWFDSEGPVEVDLAHGQAKEWDGGLDTLKGIVGALGSAFDDTLNGDSQANRLEGGEGKDTLDAKGGDDILVGGAGEDALQGGDGNDTADFSGAGPVQASLNTGRATDASGSVDTLAGIENLTGSLGNDILIGDAGVNRLEGGVGADALQGGAGADAFVYHDTLDFGDTIGDFKHGVDVIEIDQSAVGAGDVRVDAASGQVLWVGEGEENSLVVATVGGELPTLSDIHLV